MLIEKLIEELNNEELKNAFLEIKEWMETGVLYQQGIVKSIHSDFEEKLGYEQNLRVTENAILFEIGRRFIEFV